MTITVAIIDDGINPKFIPSDFRSYQIQEGKVQQVRINPIQDQITHGTICTAIFCHYASNYEIHNLQIIESGQHKSNINHLVTALKWCLAQQIQLIQLSAGTIYFGDFGVLNQIIHELVSHNVIVVAACNNKNITTMPASLPSVIGVRCDHLNMLEKGQFYYNDNTIHNIEITSSCEYDLDEDKISQAIFKCNSFATPYISATVCNIMDQEQYTVDSIKSILKKQAVQNDTIHNVTYYERCIDSSNIIDVPIVTIINDEAAQTRNLMVELIKLFQLDGYNCIGITQGKTDIAQQLYQIRNYWTSSTFDLCLSLRMIHYTTLSDVILLELRNIQELAILYRQEFVDLHVQFMKAEIGQRENDNSNLLPDLPIIKLDVDQISDLVTISRSLYTKIHKGLDET